MRCQLAPCGTVTTRVCWSAVNEAQEGSSWPAVNGVLGSPTDARSGTGGLRDPSGVASSITRCLLPSAIQNVAAMPAGVRQSAQSGLVLSCQTKSGLGGTACAERANLHTPCAGVDCDKLTLV